MEAALGGRARIVGGYVRDLLLGRPHGSDLDVVVEDVDAGDAARWLRRHWGRREPVVTFDRFGTAQLSCRSALGVTTVEFVRARAEAYDPESRKPEVRPGTLAEDVWRRDFTVNTLLLDGQGAVEDLTGLALLDSFDQRIRTPLDPLATFAEDPLRMLRAARFAAQLEFTVDPGVARAMAQARHRLRIVSTERVRDELLRLLLARRPSIGLRLLESAGLLREVAPELASMVGVEQGGYHVGDVFTHTCLAVDLAPPDRIVRLAALLHDVGKPQTRGRAEGGPDGGARLTFHGHAAAGAKIAAGLLRRLRLPHDEADEVARLVALHMRPIQYAADWEDRAVRRLWHDAGPLRGPLMALARADTRASRYPTLAALDDLDRRLDRVAAALPRGARAPLDGHQLRERAGLGDGPWIGRAQRLLIQAVVDGQVADGDAEGAWAHLAGDPDRWAPRAGERGAPPR